MKPGWLNVRPGTRLVAAAVVLVASSVACTPRLTALSGAQFDGPVPATTLSGHRMITYRWEFTDGTITDRGDGAIRVAAPESLRVDVFLAGYTGRHAILIGDSLRTPFEETFRDMLPQAELLWAAVGRLAVPPAADTVKRAQNGLLYVDIGSEPHWRATFDSQRLVKLQKSERGRVVESVTRRPDGSVSYYHERSKRQLRITDVTDSLVAPFDQSIWRD